MGTVSANARNGARYIWEGPCTRSCCGSGAWAEGGERRCEAVRDLFVTHIHTAMQPVRTAMCGQCERRHLLLPTLMAHGAEVLRDPLPGGQVFSALGVLFPGQFSSHVCAHTS